VGYRDIYIKLSLYFLSARLHCAKQQNTPLHYACLARPQKIQRELGGGSEVINWADI